jgi:hypothetical protein
MIYYLKMKGYENQNLIVVVAPTGIPAGRHGFCI